MGQDAPGKKTNIYLIGFMGCGKSTTARYLRDKYGRKLLEMDAQIEAEQRCTISEIFARQGEERFRELETELLKKLQDRQNLVVSCGGGAAMRDCNVSEMKKNGKIVLLLASPETIYKRVRYSHNRPLLEGNMNVEYIAGLMGARMEKYKKAADFAVVTDGRTTAEICREIMAHV